MKKIFIKCKALVFLICLLVSINAKGQVTELWGTTFRGGEDNLGRIVRIDATGSIVTEAHGFPAIYPGTQPNFTNLREYNGFLYGVTPLGGKNNEGVIYRYDPLTGISQKLFDFTIANGNRPNGSLLLYNNKFYGITAQGGSDNFGTIYEFDPATNIFTKKIDLTSALGGFSNNTLAAFNNKLYATTGNGAANGFGAIIEYDPATNICTNKINLTNTPTIGRQCWSGLTLFNNKFYGAMQFAGNSNTNGVIFEWDPVTNIYTVKITLLESNPRNFTGKFISNGTVLYAISNQGPGQVGYGAIAEYNPTSNTLTSKLAFDFSTGAGAFGDLVFYNNKYYGANTIGGTNSVGAFFEWDAVANAITKRVYPGPTTGDQPNTSLTLFNGKLYGTCLYGLNGSTLVEWDVVPNMLTKKFDFEKNEGKFITSKLLSYGGKVYGVTPQGGNNDKGVLFSKDLTSGVYTVLYHFPLAATNGNTPLNALSVFNNKLYGTTSTGGSSGSGVIFEWDIATNTYTKKYDLTMAGGNQINGKFLLHSNNKFYGVARVGGGNGFGNVFSWDPVTNVYTNIVSFPSIRNVYGGFTAFGSKFYVPASNGGNANNDGTIIEFDPLTNTAITTFNFSSSIGSNPQGEFTELNGKLYTGTSAGAANGYGSIVEYTPGVGLLNKFNLDAAFPFGAANRGAGSNGMLIAYNNQLFGFATQGGLNGGGTTFKYNPSSNIFTKLEDNYTGITITTIGNGFITVQSSIVLPVTMSYFKAIKTTRKNAVLQWQTTQENNNKGFNVQRSKDGINFKTMGFVNGAGFSHTVNSYEFTDALPFTGKNYYRLEQLDVEGKITLSDIRKLDFNHQITMVTIYPNPFLQQLFVVSNAVSSASFVLTDAAGKILVRTKIIPGKNNITLQQLTAGHYFYSIRFDDGTEEKGPLQKY